MRLFAGLLLAATIAAVGGCAGTPAQSPAASPTSTSDPVFASEAEALAAAQQAYTEYLRVYDVVLNAGGEGAEALEAVSDGAALKEALEGAKDFRGRGIRSIGFREIVGLELQMIGPADVSFYVCEDVTGVALIDENGRSLVSSDRPALTAFEARLSLSGSGPRITHRALWQGDGVCGG